MGAKNTQFNVRGGWLGEYVSGKYVSYHSEQLTDATPSSGGHNASGGIISQYEDGDNPGTFYKAHIFQNSGTFTVNTLGAGFGDTVDILAIGGGGGGGNTNGGGGGAGGLVYKTGVTVTATAYPVQVGRGGSGFKYNKGNSAPIWAGSFGQDSFVGPSPSPIAKGPGGGGGGPGLDPGAWNTGGGGAAAGSGGGGGTNGGGAGTVPGATGSHPGSAPFVSPPTSWWGNAGGGGDPGGGSAPGGGGGGVVAAGINSPTWPSPGNAGGGGGITIPGPYMCGYEIKIGGGGSGGGPGSVTNNPAATDCGGGDGGSGSSPSPGAPSDIANTGSGGGGGGQYPNSDGGNGSPGFVVVRYKVSEPANTAKASGGAISFYNNKTIHIFTHPGTFTTPGSFSETVEYVVIGGGGGSGVDDGGGGGAGTYKEGTTPVGNSASVSVLIGHGGSLAYNLLYRQGGTSQFGPTIASPGGGGGGSESNVAPPNGKNGGPGGSGGGGCGGFGDGDGVSGSASAYPGTRTDPVPGSGWGMPGTDGRQNTGPAPYSGGAGGGVTTAGGGVSQGNYGGAGIQLPATFHSPELAPTPSTGNTTPGGLGTPGASGYQGPTMPGSFYVGGGGAGTRCAGPGTPSGDGQGGVGGGGWSGESPVDPASSGPAAYAGGGLKGADGTGGGGGGGDVNNAPAYWGVSGGMGGSGLVAVAYPT